MCLPPTRSSLVRSQLLLSATKRGRSAQRPNASEGMQRLERLHKFNAADVTVLHAELPKRNMLPKKSSDKSRCSRH